MSGYLGQSNHEYEPDPEGQLEAVIDRYLPDDRKFLSDMDFEDRLGYVYGQLLEMGLDPNAVLEGYGATE